MKNNIFKVALVVGTLVGFGVGGAKAAYAQGPWPNQCYNNNNNSQDCPTCGGGCLGGNYICCNNGAS